MMKKRIFSMNTVRICIDECRGSESGRAYSKLCPAPLEFSGLGEMILGMDRIFNECGYPQAFQECRSFRKQTGRASPQVMPQLRLRDEDIDCQKGLWYTFDVIVQSRRQSGWQGILMKADRSSAVSFNSEMELLMLICRDVEMMRESLTG